MPRPIYAPEALDDLLQIARYTLETWGTDQSFKYTAQIRAACRRLAQNPYLGQSLARIRPALSLYAAGQPHHLYEVSSDHVL